MSKTESELIKEIYANTYADEPESLEGVSFKAGDMVCLEDGRYGEVIRFYESASGWRARIQGPGLTHSFGNPYDGDGTPCDYCGQWAELVEDCKPYVHTPLKEVPRSFRTAVCEIDEYVYREKFNERDAIDWQKTLTRWQNKLNEQTQKPSE